MNLSNDKGRSITSVCLLQGICLGKPAAKADPVPKALPEALAAAFASALAKAFPQLETLPELSNAISFVSDLLWNLVTLLTVV